ncbi:MAG TPA: hypothetical protein VJY35_11910 [Candidatus Eisenbacteria bacterium]|nr:hypothetical protein [Candidatus Eisenbacteria bacterium]
MHTRVAAAMLMLITLLAVVVVAGCSKSSITSPHAAGLSSGVFALAGAESDTVVPPPPPPPPPPPLLALAFTGSDSTEAGTTGNLYWTVGNNSGVSLRVRYTLTCELPWPDFPRTGTLTVPAHTTLPLTTPVAVPADVPSRGVSFRLSARTPGITPSSVEGWMRVFSDVPPPPPPASPLVYLGADSVTAGGVVTQRWQVTNESTHPFVVEWRLESHSAWPGLPQFGSVSLAGKEVRAITTMAAVPDTAATGYRWLRLTVTRPDGLPNASADGGFIVMP